MVRSCWAMTDNTSISILLNSSKQHQAPDCANPEKNLPIILKSSPSEQLNTTHCFARALAKSWRQRLHLCYLPNTNGSVLLHVKLREESWGDTRDTGHKGHKGHKGHGDTGTQGDKRDTRDYYKYAFHSITLIQWRISCQPHISRYGRSLTVNKVSTENK